MRTRSNYAEIIKRHAIEHKKGYGKDEGMLVHTVIALCINTVPEHKRAMAARNYLEWINAYCPKVIDHAYSAMQDLINAGIYTVMPTKFISDGRDTSRMIPPYPYLCGPDQILQYSKDNQFWNDLQSS